MRLFTACAAVFLSLLCTTATAQYTRAAGQNAPTQAVEREVRDEVTGELRREQVVVPAPKDSYGNAHGNDFDLAIDGAFEGQTIAVMQLYVDPSFDFSLPRAALKE